MSRAGTAAASRWGSKRAPGFFAGVVESGYGRELVNQFPQLTRAELRALERPGVCWDGDEPAGAEIKYLEWVPAMGFRHATLVPDSVGPLA